MKSISRQASTIMRTSPLLQLFLVCGALAATPLPLLAQAPADTPPTLQKLEEGDAPPITIRKSEPAGKTTQKREQGVVTEEQVRSGKSTYRVRQSAGPGNAAPGDAQSLSVRPPQWQVKEFDLGRKKTPAQQAEDAAATPAPPAAAVKK